MKADNPTWIETAPDQWEAKMADGHWTIQRNGPDWVALPPNGRTYPYALASGLFRFGAFERVKLAAQEAACFQLETLGRAELRKVRKRVCQAGKIGLHRQFVVVSCGVKFDFRQAEPGSQWGILWEGHGHSGALAARSVSELFNQIRTVFLPNRKIRVWPEGLRAAFLDENKRAMSRARLVEDLVSPTGPAQSGSIDLRRILSNSALQDLRNQDASQTRSLTLPMSSRQAVAA
jgi:hypothetical protein